MTAQSAGASGRRLGRYHLAEPLGGGPTGEVFRAKVYGVAGLERQFAVKRFHSALSEDPARAARLAQAARLYSALEHPRIARVSEFGVAGGVTFTATELVRGLDLGQLVELARALGKRMPPGAALALLSASARAIGFGHGRGLSHLGVCPTNVLVTTEGDVKITDFGFLPLRLPVRPALDPSLGARLPYLAPEQHRGEPGTPATDVFQLGLLAYELLAGKAAFGGLSLQEIEKRASAAELPPIDLPKPLSRAVRRALARSPFERFPDAGALADALDASLRAAPMPGDRRDLASLVRGALDEQAAMHENQLSGALRLPVPAPPRQQAAAGAGTPRAAAATPALPASARPAAGTGHETITRNLAQTVPEAGTDAMSEMSEVTETGTHAMTETGTDAMTESGTHTVTTAETTRMNTLTRTATVPVPRVRAGSQGRAPAGFGPARGAGLETPPGLVPRPGAGRSNTPAPTSRGVGVVGGGGTVGGGARARAGASFKPTDTRPGTGDPTIARPPTGGSAARPKPSRAATPPPTPTPAARERRGIPDTSDEVTTQVRAETAPPAGASPPGSGPAARPAAQAPPFRTLLGHVPVGNGSLRPSPPPDALVESVFEGSVLEDAVFEDPTPLPDPADFASLESGVGDARSIIGGGQSAPPRGAGSRKASERSAAPEPDLELDFDHQETAARAGESHLRSARPARGSPSPSPERPASPPERPAVPPPGRPTSPLPGRLASPPLVAPPDERPAPAPDSLRPPPQGAPSPTTAASGPTRAAPDASVTVPRQAVRRGGPTASGAASVADLQRGRSPERRGGGVLRALFLLLLLGGLAAGGYFGYLHFVAPALQEAELERAAPATHADAGATAAAAAANSSAPASAPFDAGAPAATPFDAGAIAVASNTPPHDATPGPAGTGRLRIESQPKGAKVYLDGTLVGRTPIDQEPTGDRHRVALLHAGHKLHTSELRGGKLSVTLEEVTPSNGPAGIKVRCRQKNRYYVIVDGADTGQLCPTERIGVELGAHTVEIYDPVTDERRAFQIQIDQTRLSHRIRVD